MLYDKRWEIKREEKWRHVLLDAADILETDGWVQGISHSDGGYCAVGAIYAAADCGHHKIDFESALWGLEALRNSLMPPVEVWNDEPGRTKEEVIAKLREVAHAV